MKLVWESQGLVPVSWCQAPCDLSSQLYLFPTITQRRRSIHRWSLTLSVSHNALTLYLSETGTSPPGSCYVVYNGEAVVVNAMNQTRKEIETIINELKP